MKQLSLYKKYFNEDKLTYSQRKKLPDSDFAIPSERKYPIDSENRARNALARVSQSGTSEEKEKVKKAVHAKYPNIEISESCDCLEGYENNHWLKYLPEIDELVEKQKTVRGYLSPEGGDISDSQLDTLANVYATRREAGDSKEKASKIAWSVVNKNK